MMRRLRLLARDQRGAAVVELALIAPILAALTVGAVDMSSAYGRKLELQQAAQRAIEKVANTTGVDTVEDTIKTEAVAQAKRITTDQVQVTFRLECGATHVIQADPDGDCVPGQATVRYILVTVTDKYSPLFRLKYAGVNADGTYHLIAQAGVRVQ